MSLISVIIPAYNAAKTIERTVRSVLASTIPLDIWIVDDGSTDGTSEILEDFRKKVEVEGGGGERNGSTLHVLRQPNSGAYQARLNALKQIQTPYFGFVDADDTVEPDMFEKLLAFAKKENLDVVQVKWNTERPVGNPNPSRIPQSNNPKSNNPQSNNLQSNNLQSNNQTILSGLTDIFNAIVRPIMWEGRDSSFIWDKIYRNQYDFSTFDPTDHVTNFDDLIFNLQFFTKVTRMGFIDEPLYHYNETVGSATRKFKWKIVKDFRETFRIRRKLAPAYGVHPWGWMNFRWFVKNARNLVAVWLGSQIQQSNNLKSNNQTMKRFVAIMNIPSPYRLHLLGELARQLQARGVEFHCHFLNRGHKDRPQSWLNPKIDFSHTYWRNFGPDQHEFNPGLILKMMFSRPDWMICGSSFDTFTGIGVQLFGRAKTKLCWLEGNTKTPGRLDGPLGWFKRLIIGRCRFAAVPGSDAAKYIGLHQARTKTRMPMPVYLPNLVDEARFAGGVKGEREVEKVGGGGQWSVRTCIIPARLEAVKGLVPFFELLTPEMLQGWKIVLMGQGPLKAEIEATLAKRGISEFVQIVDYVPYEEMPGRYAAADLLLLPSIYDPNPLSVIEALHSGLAVAVTDQAGNVEEAVTEGENGWVLPVLDKTAFAAKLKAVLATEKSRLKEMGRISKERNAAFWNTKAAIGRFLDQVLGAGSVE